MEKLKLNKLFFYKWGTIISNTYILAYSISFALYKYSEDNVYKKLQIILFLIFLLSITYVINFKEFERIFKDIIVIIIPISVFIWIYGASDIFHSFTDKFEDIGILKLLLLIFSIIIIICIRYSRRVENSIPKKLVDSRKGDLERISELLNDVNIVGINGQWGEGKTFFVNKLLTKLKKENGIEAITVNLLNVNKDDIFLLIIRQIERILSRNGIYTAVAKQLKNFLGSQDIKGVNLLELFSNKTNQEILEDYKILIKSLRKNIIIIFDDLDRVGDVEKIKVALNFGVEFSQENLKVLYLYNQEELSKYNLEGQQLNREYVEKFIPFHHYLTPISFEDIMKTKGIIIEPENKYNFLYALLSENPGIFFKLNKIEENNQLKCYRNIIMTLEKEAVLNFNNPIAFRRIEIFVQESNSTLRYLKSNNIEIEDRIVISYCFIKNFCYKEYEKMKKFKSLEENFPVNFSKGDIIVTLEEMDLIYNLLQEKNNLSNEYLFNKYKLVSYHNWNLSLEKINNTLKKVNLNLSDDLTLSNGNGSVCNLSDLRVLFSNFLVIEDNKVNLMIRILFNQFLFSNEKTYIDFERLETIESSIKKLIYIGETKYLSSYRATYQSLKKVLYSSSREEQLKNYNEFFHYCQYQKDFNSVYYFGESHKEKTLKVIITCGSLEEEKLFFEMFEPLKLDDEYLKLILISRCISDYNFTFNLIDKIIKWETNIQSKKLLIDFIATINNTLRKKQVIDYIYPGNRDDISYIIFHLNQMINKKYYEMKIYPFIKDEISKINILYKKFLELLETTSDEEPDSNLKNLVSSSEFHQSPCYKEEAIKLKELSPDLGKLEFEKLAENYNYHEIEIIFEELKKL